MEIFLSYYDEGQRKFHVTNDNSQKINEQKNDL